jgi:hypothetical protein
MPTATADGMYYDKTANGNDLKMIYNTSDGRYDRGKLQRLNVFRRPGGAASAIIIPYREMH